MNFYKPNIKILLSIGSLYSLLIFVWLLLSKSYSSDIFFLNYSFARFMMILVIGLVLSLFLLGLFLYKKLPIFESEKIHSFFLSKVSFYFLFVTLVVSILIIICTLSNSFKERNIYFERGLPLFVESFFISLEFIAAYVFSDGVLARPIINSYISFGQILAMVKNKTHAQKNLILFLSLWGLMVFINRIFFPISAV